MSYRELFIGIDVSKFKHDVAIMTEFKQLLRPPFVIGNDKHGFRSLLNICKQLRQKYGVEKFYVGMEATSDYWKNLYYFLKTQSQFSVTVINPLQTKAFAQSNLRRAKTDPINAQDIALFMVERRPPASVDRAPEYEIIKDIDRQIYHLKKQQTMVVNKLRLELTKVAPELEAATKSIATKQMLALLVHYPTAEAIATASVDELRRLRYGDHRWHLPLSFIHRVKALTQDSIAFKRGDGAGCVVQSLARFLTTIQQEVAQLKHQAKELYHVAKEQQSLLATIPGISEDTAIILEAYIGDVHRFANARKLVAYFGMNPVVSLSGVPKKNTFSFLQKKGNPIVRAKLFMATLSMIRFKIEPIYSFYKRLVDSGKPKLVAINAAMRKLLVIIYHMLKNNEPFKNNKNQ